MREQPVELSNDWVNTEKDFLSAGINVQLYKTIQEPQKVWLYGCDFSFVK